MGQKKEKQIMYLNHVQLIGEKEWFMVFSCIPSLDQAFSGAFG